MRIYLSWLCRDVPHKIPEKYCLLSLCDSCQLSQVYNGLSTAPRPHAAFAALMHLVAWTAARSTLLPALGPYGRAWTLPLGPLPMDSCL